VHADGSAGLEPVSVFEKDMLLVSLKVCWGLDGFWAGFEGVRGSLRGLDESEAVMNGLEEKGNGRREVALLIAPRIRVRITACDAVCGGDTSLISRGSDFRSDESAAG